MRKEQKNEDQWDDPLDDELEEEDLVVNTLCMAVLVLIILLLSLPAAVLWTFVKMKVGS